MTVDQKNNRIYYFDSGSDFDVCSDDVYFCVTKGIEFSVPLDPRTAQPGRKWQIGDVQYEIKCANGIVDCDLDDESSFVVTGYDTTTKVTWAYLYSYRGGVMLINIIEGNQFGEGAKQFDSYFSCRSGLFSDFMYE